MTVGGDRLGLVLPDAGVDDSVGKGECGRQTQVGGHESKLRAQGRQQTRIGQSNRA